MFDKLFELGEKPYSADDAAWDAFVHTHPNGSLLQLHNWARLKNRFGWSSHRVWLKKDGRFVAGAQILYRSAALGIAKIGYIPHGPLVDWDDAEQVEVLLNQIDHSAYQRGVGLIKMEPLLWSHHTPRWPDLRQQHNLSPDTDSIQPPRTLMIDIQSSDDDILAAMHQKTRYNIRLSARKEITVREGSRADIPVFNKLMQLTGQRDSFGTHAPEYYRDVYDLFAPDHLVLLLAEYDKRPLAAVMIAAVGKTAVYLYGASSNEERNRMPSYAVQWAAIQWAKQRGCTHYDLWGVPDADETTLEAGFQERSDGLWPVYRFKRGFGGQLWRTVGPVDRIYNQRVKSLYNWWRKKR
jgi:lipid II:glycine glycyltransferase (peptidoglycan interpeptide bridge formation enzyme)